MVERQKRRRERLERTSKLLRGVLTLSFVAASTLVTGLIAALLPQSPAAASTCGSAILRYDGGISKSTSLRLYGVQAGITIENPGICSGGDKGSEDVSVWVAILDSSNNASQTGYIRNPFYCTLDTSEPCYFDEWESGGTYSPVNAYWEVQQGSYPVNNTFEVISCDCGDNGGHRYWELDNEVNGYIFDQPDLGWIQNGYITGQDLYIAETHDPGDYVPGSYSQPIALFGMEHNNGSWVDDDTSNYDFNWTPAKIENPDGCYYDEGSNAVYLWDKRAGGGC